MAKRIIGIMGPGNPHKGEEQREFKGAAILRLAYDLGALIAKENWVLLTGGRAAGVMESASRGAKEADGLTLGILPDADKEKASEFVDLAVPTAMGSARNYINILASDFVVACGMGTGTASEVSLALKEGKEVIMLGAEASAVEFFQGLSPDLIKVKHSPQEVIDYIKSQL